MGQGARDLIIPWLLCRRITNLSVRSGKVFHRRPLSPIREAFHGHGSVIEPLSAVSRLQRSSVCFVINTINVEVRDVTDSVLRAAVRCSVTLIFRHLAGAWNVRVSASGEPGRWDLHVHGAFGHHVSHFLTSPAHLAEHVERRLRAFLSSVVPPLSAAPRRPVLVVRNRLPRAAPDPQVRFPIHRRAS